MLVLSAESITLECNKASVRLFNQKIMNLEDNIEFYQQALTVLKTIKKLVQEEKYIENKTEIEELIRGVYNDQ